MICQKFQKFIWEKKYKTGMTVFLNILCLICTIFATQNYSEFNKNAWMILPNFNRNMQ